MWLEVFHACSSFFFRDLKEPIKEWKTKLGTPLLDSPENSKKHLELIQGIRASKRHNHTEMIWNAYLIPSELAQKKTQLFKCEIRWEQGRQFCPRTPNPTQSFLSRSSMGLSENKAPQNPRVKLVKAANLIVSVMRLWQNDGTPLEVAPFDKPPAVLFCGS